MSLKDQLLDTIKLTGFQIVYYLVRCLPARREEGSLLLVKTDELGDYVLIRNLLGEFRRSDAFKEHKITFIGNVVFRQLYDTYDQAIADEVIWLDKKKFRRDLFYRFSILRKIRRAGFSDAVNLVYSRGFRVDDLLIAVSTSGSNTGMESAHLPVSRVERSMTPRHLYHRLIQVGEEGTFDACKNARFIGQLLNISIDPVTTFIDARDNTSFALPPAYFIIFPGSGEKIRKWPAGHFAAVAEYMVSVYGLEPVVCGSGADREDTGLFIQAYGRPVTDLTGKTSLPEFLAVLKGAACIFSVDTGAVHMAAAVKCPVFGLFSGRYYGRFAPYPKKIAPAFTAIYPDEIDERLRNGRLGDINTIPVDLLTRIPAEKVIDKVKTSFTATVWGGSGGIGKGGL